MQEMDQRSRRALDALVPAGRESAVGLASKDGHSREPPAGNQRRDVDRGRRVVDDLDLHRLAELTLRLENRLESDAQMLGRVVSGDHHRPGRTRADPAHASDSSESTGLAPLSTLLAAVACHSLGTRTMPISGK